MHSNKSAVYVYYDHKIVNTPKRFCNETKFSINGIRPYLCEIDWQRATVIFNITLDRTMEMTMEEGGIINYDTYTLSLQYHREHTQKEKDDI